MQKYCSVATLHYVSASCYDEQGRQNCSVHKCVAYFVEDNDCLGCHQAGVDLGDLIRIVDMNQVPVISASVTAGKLELEVQGKDPKIPYVAISHAWSGGLGNPRFSSLPTCQVERIVSILQPLFGRGSDTASMSPTRRLAQTVLRHFAPEIADQSDESQCIFWIDTLCIPTKYEVGRQSTTRIKALSPMNRIYAEAIHVVGLDTTLKPPTGKSQVSLASSFLTTPWMTRCWTYGERRLAQDLLVTTNEKLRPPFVLYDTITRKSTFFNYYYFV